MKKTLILLSILTSFVASAQSIEINPNAANSSAVLDLKSTTKGFLLPRMINAQMLAIPNPAQGLLAFCTDCGTNGDYYFYKGTAWVALGSTTVSVSTTVGPVRENAIQNGATIINGNLSLAPANASYPGIVTIGAQTIAGVKTFSNGIVGNVTGDVTGNAATVSTNANLTGDVTSIGNAATVVKINGTSLSGLATGLLKNTTGTGVPTIATAGTDYQLPITLTTTGSGVATLSLNTLNIPNVSYTLPTATSSTLGGVKPDGTSILNNAGVLSVTPLSIGAQAAGSYLTSSTGVTTFNGSTTGLTPASATSGAVTLGGVLVGANGGTGVANTGKTITLGGNLTTSGAFTTALTTTANTAVTLPVSGTLATLAGTETLINKTFTTPNLGTPSAAILTNATGLRLTDGAGVTGILPVANGGTGSSTLNFVDLTNNQTIAGVKTFSSDLSVNGLTVGKGREGIFSNTAIGTYALAAITTGDNNTANGTHSLKNNTSGTNNTANGVAALQSNTIGSANTANGTFALSSNINGSYNTAIGWNVLQANTLGSSNTAIGIGTLNTNTSGSNNTAIGSDANVASGALTNATAIGNGASVDASHKIQLGNGDVTAVQLGTGTKVTLETGFVKITGGTPGVGKVLTSDANGFASWSTVSGGGIPYTGATGPVNLGAYDLTVNGLTVGKGRNGISTNSAIGLNALQANITGVHNTAIGLNTLNSNTTGNNNTANGMGALLANTEGSNNTANGVEALLSNTRGVFNTANGRDALKSNTTGNSNTATGQSLSSNTTGNNNTANGSTALGSNTEGSDNTANGYLALNTNTTGSNNTAIGKSADVASGALTNATAIGNGAIVNASHKIQLGNGAVTAVQLGTGTNVTLETGFLKITGGTLGAGKVLTSDADGLASWATLPLSSGVTGTLPIANGGTGATTLASNNVLLGNGTSALQAVAPGANGNVLTSNGTTWTSAAAPAVAAAAGTLTGNTLASTVVGSSLTSVGTLTSATVSGKVTVGASSATATSAVLEANSTTQGFLPPRMTGAQRNLINNPVQGLMIYCTDCGADGEPEYYNGRFWANMSGVRATGSLKIGDEYQGGKVAYILTNEDIGYDANTQHGIIAAITNSTSAERIRWNNGIISFTNATGNGIGAGVNNTNTIIQSQGETVRSYAAGLARSCNDGNYNDWYLPSKDELNKLYINRVALGDNFGTYSYWSSTEIDSYYVWYQDFNSGGQRNTLYKGNTLAVRAIRYF